MIASREFARPGAAATTTASASGAANVARVESVLRARAVTACQRVAARLPALLQGVLAPRAPPAWTAPPSAAKVGSAAQWKRLPGVWHAATPVLVSCAQAIIIW